MQQERHLADVHKTFPLTEIQYAYWVGRGPNFILGNVSPHAYFELEGRRLDPQVLTDAWRHLVARHEMLRTVVDADGRQRVLPQVPDFTIECEDLSASPAELVEARLEVRRAEMSARVYDAADWPLFDIAISRLADHDRLHISLDLLVVDLAGITLLFDEWNQLCRDPQTQLPPVDVTFRDYAAAMEAGRDNPRYQRSLEYWTSRAETIAPPPDLPLAKSPADVLKPVFTHREFRLLPAQWRTFQERAEERGLTPTAVLATVFAETLRTWSTTPRFTLNLTLFNRLPVLLSQDAEGRRKVHPHLSRMVGEFTSICLLEMDTTGDLPFGDQVRRTQTQLQQDLRHRYVSALETLREQRRRGLQSGFETMPVVFTSGLGTVTDVRDAMDQFGEMTYRLSQTPQVWLDHQVVEIGGSLDLSWDAVEELFPDGLLDDMFQAYCAQVEHLAHDEDAWEQHLTVPLPTHQHAVRARANDTAAAAPEGLLHDGLLKWAVQDPGRTAVVAGDATLTYGELAGRAHAVADGIAGLHAGTPAQDTLVGVSLPKGAAQVAAACGVLLAGAAYLPVAPALPARRRHALLTDGAALAVVTDVKLDACLEWPENLPRLVPGTSDAATPGAEARAQDAGQLAYVLYTSGSTGTPKGVMIEHRAALNTVIDINDRFAVGPQDSILGLAELGFDLSVYDIFGALSAGATLVLPDEELRGEPAHWAELLDRHAITVWNSVPAQMQMLVEHVEAGTAVPGELRLVLLSGDWVPLDLPARINALWPQARVIGLGGATEAAIWSNWHPADQVPDGLPSVPYGKPLTNQAFHVLDARMRPCPTWVAGELYIAGAGLARGYWNDAERTAASFVTHPVSGERLYRTGDFGRYLPDGTLQFLGRKDSQVKIGGHRIECGEIESVLTDHPGVDRAVVVKSLEQQGNARLLGYVVPDPLDTTALCRTTADPGPAAERWQALCSATNVVAQGPSPEGLSEVWAALDDLHASGAAVMLRDLGLPADPGGRFALKAVTAAGVAPRYERWVARAAGVLARRGHLRADADGYEVVRELPHKIPQEVLSRAFEALTGVLGVANDLADWMLSLSGDLADVLTQSVHSAELYASDRTPEVYRSLFDPTYDVAAEAVRRFLSTWPADRPLRVLEVGSGYGTLTGQLLPLFPPERTDYLFTDISPFFTDRARRVFAEYDFVRHGMFNLDRAPELQGHDTLTADLIIAASVLHDTRRVDDSLRTLRSALAPGGTLLMVEQTLFHPWYDLLMGLQQGFDGYEDTQLRTEHPLLDREQWAQRLTAAGFTRSSTLSGGAPAAVGLDVLVAQGPLEQRRFDIEALRAHAAERLPKHMVPSQLVALDRLPLNHTGKVDRGALARAGSATAAQAGKAVPPVTDRQIKLVALYREVLGTSEVDLASDFLNEGGDSLLAARITAGLQRAFDLTVPIATILRHPTVGAVDQWLESQLGPSTPPTVQGAQEQA